MSTLFRAWMTMNAAWREAAREHRAELDTEHILLGLLASGGSAARVLAAHGVTLAGGREAVQRVRTDRLGQIGIDAAEVPVRDIRDIADLHFQEVGRLPMTTAAQRVLDDGSFRNSLRVLSADRSRPDFETGILRDLLVEPSGRITEIVRACGAAPAALLADCAASGGRRGKRRARPGVSTQAGLVGAAAPLTVPARREYWPARTPASALSVGHFVSAHHARVSSVLCDAALIERLFGFRNDGEQQAGDHEIRRADSADGAIVWVRTMAGHTADEGMQSTGYERFELVGAPGGTTVLWERSWRTYGRLARPVLAVSRLTMRGSTMTPMLNLSDACASE